MMKLPAEDVQFLIQFIENCEESGTLWRIGKGSDGNYVVTALIGTQAVSGAPKPKLHQAVKACVETASVMGAASVLEKG